MLLAFSLKNYKSFADRCVLALTAKQSEKMIPGAVRPLSLPGTSAEAALVATAIYGANASGKTNLLLGLEAMADAIRFSQGSWKPRQRINVDPNICCLDDPSEFEIEIFCEGVRYRYGFECDNSTFKREWLYSYPKGRERTLFIRKTVDLDDGFSVIVEFGTSLSGPKRDLDSTVRRVRQNSLFLTAASQDNQLECLSIFNWFDRNLRFSGLNDYSDTKDVTTLMAHQFSRFKKLLIPFLKIGDQSIETINTKKFDESPDDSDSHFRDIDQFRKELQKYSVEFSITDGKNSYNIDYDKESRGVKKLYNMAFSIITALEGGHILVVDELESSMHSHVAAQLLALFQNSTSNPNGAQLIFTTHETRLLSLEHLRRDQIWFCERTGVTSNLYPLTDFSPRKDENFEENYLRGKFGGIPRASVPIEWIMEINDQGENEIEGNS